MEKKLKDLLIQYGAMMGVKNFTPGVSGNLSARYGDKILITASGVSNAFLCEDDIVEIDFKGNRLNSDVKKPSSEWLLHVKYYQMRPDVNFIVHVHSPYLSSFAAARLALDEPVLAENVYYFGKIPLANYALPSSTELVEETSKYFKEYNAVLMANHGFITAATTMKEAYMQLELAESYAQVVFNAKQLGGAICLSENEVAQIVALK